MNNGSAWSKLTSQKWFKDASSSLSKAKEKIEKGTESLLKKIDGIDHRD
jgi:hypothetical protein